MRDSNLFALEQLPNPDTIGVLEEALDMAKRGELQTVMIVGSLKNGNTFRSHSIQDRLTVVGQLELAKNYLLSGFVCT